MLEFEELVLRQTSDNYLIINYGDDDEIVETEISSSTTAKPSIVMGLSGKADLLLDTQKVSDDSIQVLRRYTGGGTVIVDNSTFFVALIMNTADAACRPFPREIMDWTDKAIYSPTFLTLLNQGNDEDWMFKLRENDYILKDRKNELDQSELFDKKIGGNAQTITKGRWVHHTSFLWDFDPHNMTYLLMPAKRPEYRKDRPHTDFITQLKDKISSLSALEDAVVKYAGQHFDEVRDAQDHSGTTSLADYQATSSWLLARSPTFKSRSHILSSADRFSKNPV